MRAHAPEDDHDWKILPMTGARLDAQNLVAKLLIVAPSERLSSFSAEDIMKHSWFKGDKEAVRQAE